MNTWLVVAAIGLAIAAIYIARQPIQQPQSTQDALATLGSRPSTIRDPLIIGVKL